MSGQSILLAEIDGGSVAIYKGGTYYFTGVVKDADGAILPLDRMDNVIMKLYPVISYIVDGVETTQTEIIGTVEDVAQGIVKFTLETSLTETLPRGDYKVKIIAYVQDGTSYVLPAFILIVM